MRPFHKLSRVSVQRIRPMRAQQALKWTSQWLSVCRFIYREQRPPESGDPYIGCSEQDLIPRIVTSVLVCCEGKEISHLTVWWSLKKEEQIFGDMRIRRTIQRFRTERTWLCLADEGLGTQSLWWNQDKCTTTPRCLRVRVSLNVWIHMMHSGKKRDLLGIRGHCI